MSASEGARRVWGKRESATGAGPGEGGSSADPRPGEAGTTGTLITTSGGPLSGPGCLRNRASPTGIALAALRRRESPGGSPRSGPPGRLERRRRRRRRRRREKIYKIASCARAWLGRPSRRGRPSLHCREGGGGEGGKTRRADRTMQEERGGGKSSSRQAHAPGAGGGGGGHRGSSWQGRRGASGGGRRVVVGRASSGEGGGGGASCLHGVSRGRRCGRCEARSRRPRRRLHPSQHRPRVLPMKGD